VQSLTGFAALADQFDGFILDLWGVIHDGVRPYPGAVDCLERLRDAGKTTVLLSNAPRRNAGAQALMHAMGIPDTLYTDILTSGEATYIALGERPDAWWQSLGRRVYHLGPDRDRNVIEGLDLVRVDTPAEADFVLNTGPDDHQSQTDAESFIPILEACRSAGLKMICANPDLEVLRGGVRVICAGTLALMYEAADGDVRWIGKPDPEIYEAVFDRLRLPRDRVLAVGDALRTDMAGAKAAGIAGCWVLGGLHAESLGNDPALIEAARQEAGLDPLACIPSFVW
jgi:HAD superfamily hydrolase (TIGR01459 family)